MIRGGANPLVDDRDIEFLLYEVLQAEDLCRLAPFADHSRETFDLFIESTRRISRDLLFPAYKPMDEQPARFSDGAITVHPRMREIYPRLIALGLLTAARPHEVGGAQLPITVFTLAQLYLGAANLSAYGFVALSAGVGHLLEAFGSPFLRDAFMPRVYRGEWAGTMALTEPQAGSSLADIQSAATPLGDGKYRVRGAKIFITAGDHDLTENIVHMVLARIDGAPAGTKGISLFAVPKRRPDGTRLVPNDVHVAGAIHKIGWRGLPSLVMSFGEADDCHGWLVGEPNRGLAHMFQMMNEARISVGASATATASVAYHEAVAYARTRPQGRALTSRDPAQSQVPIIEHADVRRMLLRQKAIVEGALALIGTTARLADLAAHAATDVERRRAQLLLDLLTPVAKSFPAEKGFEANALAVQVHGGYGYSSEYLPEAWLRDQKLNSIHEGTTGIHSLDLLGRKVVAEGGNALRALLDEIQGAVARARQSGVEEAWCAAVEAAAAEVGQLTMELAQAGLGGDVERMLRHSADYLELFSVVVVAWMWLVQAAAACAGLARHGDDAFYLGKCCAAQYWIRTELPRVAQLAALCRSDEDSYARMKPEWF